MRTTVTLDNDVAAALDRIQSEEHATFRKVLNDLVREGLAAREHRRRQQLPTVRTTQARALGPRFSSFDRISELIALIEGETHK